MAYIKYAFGVIKLPLAYSLSASTHKNEKNIHNIAMTAAISKLFSGLVGGWGGENEVLEICDVNPRGFNE